MMRIVVAFFLGLSILLASNVDRQIRSSQKKLQLTKRQIQGVNTKLAKLARDIRSLTRELKQVDAKIQTLNVLIKSAQEKYQQQIAEYNQTKEQITQLSMKEKKLQQELILLISNSFAKSLLLTSMENPTDEDLIKEEILKSIQAYEDERLKKVSNEYKKTKEALEKKQKRLKELEKSIATYLKNRGELERLKKRKQKSLALLKKKQKRYDQEKNDLLAQQRELAATLKRLQIIKESQRRARASKGVKVKKYEQNYKKLRTLRYTGPKTIAPLDKFIITKRYGIYKDPIYNIEIPNENIELKPLMPNAKVRNVLNGKIVLAKWTPHLRNVVVVKHSGGLYTIYAYIDKLSPYVKKGRRIKKGYVLGRVNTKLIFEVTKNNAHINPLDLIKVR